DGNVTGVKTCALPICGKLSRKFYAARFHGRFGCRSFWLVAYINRIGSILRKCAPVLYRTTRYDGRKQIPGAAMPATPLPLSTPSRNLVRLTIVRGITWTGFLVATIFGLEILGFELRAAAVIGVIVCMGLVNLFTWWRLGRQWAVSDMEYLLHLLVDVIGLTLLFYLTGGCNNPFISYYLVPVTIAAATLPWHYA